MPRKKSKSRVYKPRSAKMWVESLEKRELLAASDVLLPATKLSWVEDSSNPGGHALSDKPEDALSGTVDFESKPAPKAGKKRSTDDDSVIVFIV